MSWLSGITSRAEELLNKVDQSAADAFNTELDSTGWSPPSRDPIGPVDNVDSAGHKGGQVTYQGGSVSVPSDLNRITSVGHVSGHNARTSNASPAANVTRTNTKPRKDQDDELFEFLNSSDGVTDGNKRPKFTISGKHSRTSSISSNTSTRSNLVSAGSSRDKAEPNTTTDEVAASANHKGSSIGYHSNHEDDQSEQQKSSVELENELLKAEVSSLNHEMTSVIRRAKVAEQDLKRAKQRVDSYNANMSESDKLVRELQARDLDLHEALKVKDAQLAVLRVRFEEADTELSARKLTLESVETEKDRILQDHTSVSGAQNQALESLKLKLHEAEISLKREQDAYRAAQEESTTRRTQLEEDRHSLSAALTAVQKKADHERGQMVSLTNQLKSAKAATESSKRELIDYKDKAARILQSKDRLIATLKSSGTGEYDGLATSGSLSVELEEIRQDREVLRGELQHCRMTIENLRADTQDLETQMQAESDSAEDQIRALEDQLADERRRRHETEQEAGKQKLELQFAHEEIYKEKTNYQSRLQSRESEISKLRSQLVAKSANTTTEGELEGRVRALTESLIHKQTMLEALGTEKYSLSLQLERCQIQYKELQACSGRTTSTAVLTMSADDEDVRQRLPVFMRENPQDNNVIRNVKRATNTIDRFGVRLGVFLRRYPAARIFVILYMALLHFWTLVVLLTYQPEIHSAGSVNYPQAPNPAPQSQH